MSFDLKEIIAARLGENYQLHHRHLNRTLVAAQRVIGFDKVYARAEGAYLYDMDNTAYLDFLSGYSVFNIGRNHPVVKKAIRDVLDLDLPNMVQMDCSLLSGLLAEAITKRTPPHLDAVFFCNSGTEAMEGALKFARAATETEARYFARKRLSRTQHRSLSFMGCESFTEGFGPLMEGWDTRIALDDIATLERELVKARCRGLRHRTSAGQRGANLRRGDFFLARAGALPEIRHTSRLRRNPDRSRKNRQDVWIPALEPGTGHHHPGQDLERWLRPVRGDRDPARHLPKDFQPNGSVRGSLDYFRSQQSRDGLRPGCARSNRSTRNLIESAARNGRSN